MAEPPFELLTTDPSVVLARGPAVVRWPPEIADVIPDLGVAVEAFEPISTAAGDSTYAWLLEHGLDVPAESVPYLLLARGGQLHGFYALANGEVELTTAHRGAVGASLRFPRQPAIIVTQLGRDRRWEQVNGKPVANLLVAHAVAMATRAARWSAATVLAVDPFDEETNRIWRRRFGFRPSRDELPGRSGLKRLWVPLPPG
jgi:hypothetical protein